MQIAIVTIFPQMFDSFVCEGMTRRALEAVSYTHLTLPTKA